MSTCSSPCETAFLQHTACDNGIEAWVSLNKKDMVQFQQDGDIASSPVQVKQHEPESLTTGL